jgi:DnaK suppressor protein
MQKKVDLQTIGNKLKEQRVILLARLERKQESIQTDDVLNPDQDDRAMTSRNNSRETLLLNRTKRQLHEIDQALNRLETGSYGSCSDCGENIQSARLEIMPTAVLCINCQRNEENK